MKQLLIGKKPGTPVEFKVILGFSNIIDEKDYRDIMVVNEFNTSTQCSENIIVTAHHSPNKRKVKIIPSTNDNILDICVNRQDGEQVTISGTICPVKNTTCIECLRIKEFNANGNDLEEVWVCPMGARNIHQCKLSK